MFFLFHIRCQRNRRSQERDTTPVQDPRKPSLSYKHHIPNAKQALRQTLITVAGIERGECKGQRVLLEAQHEWYSADGSTSWRNVGI